MEDPSLKPCYLFALVAGNFDQTIPLPLLMYVPLHLSFWNAVALIVRTMLSNPQTCHGDEHAFGCVYDLDIYMVVAVSDFNMGAMENKGLNIFNTKYVLADRETATDQDFMNVERVIGHELL